VAKHRIPKKRRARKAALAGIAAAGIASALVLGHATNTTAANFMVQLSNTVIGAGGQGDPMSARVPDKLTGMVVPDDYDYYGVEYPATINLQDSREIGLPIMHTAIIARSTEANLIVAGYSEGALIAEKERRNLQAMDPKFAPSNTQLSFLQIASPFAGNGGLYGRFPGIAIPIITDAMGVGQATRYDTTYVAREYDMYADFPAYFNPLAIANSLLAIRYGHPDAYYDPLLAGTSPAYVTTVHNTAQGSTDTYVLYHATHLPLLGPVRELARLMFLMPLTEPMLSAVEPLLRLVIDMGYTDRVNADPATPTPFSFITPPAKIFEAVAGLPGALTRGATNLLNGGQTAITLPDPHGTLMPAPSLPPVSSRAPETQHSQARLAIIPDPEPKPIAKIDDTPPKPSEQPTATPTPSTTSNSITSTSTMSTSTTSTSTTSTSTTSTTSTTTSNTPGDGLHPAVTSEGNKVMPGSTTIDDSPATATGTSTSTTTIGTIGTTRTTRTTTTGTTASTGTAGTTAGESADHESPASNAA
jgi:PE-PPE domain-containing protein